MRNIRLLALLLFCVLAAANACSNDGSSGLHTDGDQTGSDSDLPDTDADSENELDAEKADGDNDESDSTDDDIIEKDKDNADSESADGDIEPDSDLLDADAFDTDQTDADKSEEDEFIKEVYAPEYCAYFLTGEVDLVGTDADNDGVLNGWDHCPNNPYDWLDSDRDGIGNRSDPDMDGDGIANEEDTDRDGDGIANTDEEAAGNDPSDPSSIPGLRRFDTDLGVFNPNPGWYIGDLHVHVEYSHDSSASLASYIPTALDAGLDFLCITDHDVFEAPFDPSWNQQDLLFVPGMEWGGGGGHANQWGIRTWNDAATNAPEDIRQSWRLARLQGGVQSLNHYGAQKESWDLLFSAAPDLLDALDTIEVWNLVWAFQTATNEPSIALWEQLLSAGHHIGAVGGGDTHSPLLTLGSPTTVVWAESLTVPGILHGIRSGRTYITQADPLSFTGRPELDFRVDADGDGIFEAMLGDEVPPGTITLQVNIKNAKGPAILIRNGAEIARFADHATGTDIAHTVTDDAPPGAWYRVEMRESAVPFAPMRLFSSAIYVGN